MYKSGRWLHVRILDFIPHLTLYVLSSRFSHELAVRLRHLQCSSGDPRRPRGLEFVGSVLPAPHLL